MFRFSDEDFVWSVGELLAAKAFERNPLIAESRGGTSS
jgi:hypothetical protein